MNRIDRNRIDRRRDRVQTILLFTLVAISLGISVWALIISHTDDSLIFSPNAFSDIVGLVFTVIGAVFSFYFVIVGINAHRIKNDLVRFEKELKMKQEYIIADFGKVELEHQDTLYSHLIQQAQTIEDIDTRKKIIHSLRLSRARLATKSKLLSFEIRNIRIPELMEFGEKSDIEDLKKLLKDPKEDERIKDLAIGIIPIIAERLKKESQTTHD